MDKEQTPKLSEPKIIDTYNKQQGYWYVHRDQSYWDKEKKQTRHIRTTIGKRLSKDGPIIYNDRFKAEQLQSIPPEAAISRTQQLGETLILDAVVDELKIMKHLTKAFGKDSAEKIIGLAEYVICTKRALSWAGDWAEDRNEHIEGMTSQSVSKFLSALKPDARNIFFKTGWQQTVVTQGTIVLIQPILAGITQKLILSSSTGIPMVTSCFLR